MTKDEALENLCKARRACDDAATFHRDAAVALVQAQRHHLKRQDELRAAVDMLVWVAGDQKEPVRSRAWAESFIEDER